MKIVAVSEKNAIVQTVIKKIISKASNYNS